MGIEITAFGLAATAVALSAVGAGVSAYGMYASGQAQKQQNKYQQAVVQQQAILAKRAADQNTQLVQLQASQDTKQLQRKYAVLEGAQKAARAASGLGGGSKTEGDIATDTFRTQSLDEQAIRYNADLKSWNISQNAGMEVWGLDTQANMYGMAAKNAAIAGNIGAGSTILQGASSVAMGASGLSSRLPKAYGAYGGSKVGTSIGKI